MTTQRRASMSAVPGGHVATFHAPLTTTEDYDQEVNNNSNNTMADTDNGCLVNSNSESDRPWWQFGGGGNNNSNNAQQRRRASVSSDDRLSSNGNLSAGDFGDHHQQHKQQRHQGRHNNNSGNGGPWWAFASFKSTAATASSDLEASNRSSHRNNNNHRQYHHHHHQQQQQHEILIDFPTKQRQPRNNSHSNDDNNNDNSTSCSMTNTQQQHLDDHDNNDHHHHHHADDNGGVDFNDFNYSNNHNHNHHPNNCGNHNAPSSMRRASDSDDNRSWWSFADDDNDDNDDNDNNPCNHPNNNSNNNSSINNDYESDNYYSNYDNDDDYNNDNNGRYESSTTNTGMSLYRDIVSKEFIKRNSDERHLNVGDIVGYHQSCKSLDGLTTSGEEEEEDGLVNMEDGLGEDDAINNINNQDSRRFSTQCQQDSDEEEQQEQEQCNEDKTPDDDSSEPRLSIIINPQQKELLARQLTNTSEVLDKALDSFRELERSYSDDDGSETEKSSPARNKWIDRNIPPPQSSPNSDPQSINPTTTSQQWNGEHNKNNNQAFLYDYSDSDNGTHHVGTIKAKCAHDDDDDDDSRPDDAADNNDGDSSIEMGEPTYPIQIIDDSLRGNEADPETDYACGYSDTDLRNSCSRIQDKLLDKKQNNKHDDTNNGEEEEEGGGGGCFEDSENELHTRGLWRFSQPDAVSSVDREKCQEMLEAELEQCQKDEEEAFLKEKNKSKDGNGKQQQQQLHQYSERDGETGGGDVSGSEWDSARLFEIKEGVSLSKVTVLDDVSSIDSSEHSGKIPFRIFRRTSSERAVGGKSFFGWNKQQGPPTTEADYIYSGHHIVSSDVGAEYGGSEGYSKTGGGEGGDSSKGKLSWFGGSNNKDNNTPPTTETGGLASPSTTPKKNKQKSSQRSSHGKWSLASSLGWNSLDKSKTRKLQKRMSSLDEDDDEWDNSEDDDDACLENDFYSKQDARHRKVVKEACAVMGSVNKSTMTMGMEAPFCPADEMFPPMKKLHLNLGYQMDSLQAAIGDSRSSRHRARELKKAVKKNKAKSSMSLSSSLESSDQPPPPPSLMNDHKALTAYIMEQVTMMQQQQQQKTATLLESSGNRSLAMLYTAFLPNFMYFQAIASDSSSSMRPTSLCSGTGITGDEQYLQPDMLNVFSTFGSYFVGSRHLFQEESEATASTLATSTPNTVKRKSSSKGNNARRSAFWVETIHEQDSMNDSDNDGASSKSNSSSDDDSSSDGSSIGSDSKQVQNNLLEKVIADLRASQMMMEQPGARVMSNYEIRDKSMIKSSVWE